MAGLCFFLIDPISLGCVLIAVGLMIAQQAFESSATRHYPAILIGIMFVLADIVHFDHFDKSGTLSTRSLGRMQGVSNMMPGGGVMCALVVTAILCDMIDSRFSRACIFCCVASVLSLVGLMHGNNYLFSDGSEMHSKPFTTDLGEVTISIPTIPNEEISSSNFQYKVNCEWDFTLGTWSCERKCNEGWRFAIAYAALAVVNACHALYQACYPGKCPAIMDDGKISRGPAIEDSGKPSLESASFTLKEKSLELTMVTGVVASSA